MKQLHPLQLRILKKLLFAQDLRFSELKPRRNVENNLFVFHLDKLIKAGYIGKKDSKYLLTDKGKEFANRIDTDRLFIELQSKLSAWICCTRIKNRSKQYLIYTRLKQPFYSCQGFMSGKVRFGEKVIGAAKRELKEETGLEGNPKVISIKHYLVFDKLTKDLLEDKFMFLCLVENPKGKLKANKEGKFEWVDEGSLESYVTNHFESYSVFKKQIEEIKSFNGWSSFEEIVHFSVKF